MKPIREVRSTVCPLDRANVDTDQIISKEFLKRIERTGFGEYLFYHWRYGGNGQIKKDFVLNKEEYKGSEILLARRNFGCGSSREHAPWALADYGFRAIIAPGFADIFYNNCSKNGIAAIQLEEDEVDALMNAALEKPLNILVSLETESIVTEDGHIYLFEMDPYQREMLMNGWDEISLTMQLEEHIGRYESAMDIS